jgi:hypothetical protein
MAAKVKSYKGFKIQESTDTATGCLTFKVYTEEEWAYGNGYRYCEWEACSMQEATGFIDSYNTPA